ATRFAAAWMTGPGADVVPPPPAGRPELRSVPVGVAVNPIPPGAVPVNVNVYVIDAPPARLTGPAGDGPAAKTAPPVPPGCGTGEAAVAVAGAASAVTAMVPLPAAAGVTAAPEFASTPVAVTVKATWPRLAPVKVQVKTRNVPPATVAGNAENGPAAGVTEP